MRVRNPRSILTGGPPVAPPAHTVNVFDPWTNPSLGRTTQLKLLLMNGPLLPGPKLSEGTTVAPKNAHGPPFTLSPNCDVPFTTKSVLKVTMTGVTVAGSLIRTVGPMGTQHAAVTDCPVSTRATWLVCQLRFADDSAEIQQVPLANRGMNRPSLAHSSTFR